MVIDERQLLDMAIRRGLFRDVAKTGSQHGQWYLDKADLLGLKNFSIEQLREMSVGFENDIAIIKQKYLPLNSTQAECQREGETLGNNTASTRVINEQLVSEEKKTLRIDTAITRKNKQRKSTPPQGAASDARSQSTLI
jgi:hypothetical protein